MSSSIQDQVQKIFDEATSQKKGVPGIVFGMMDKHGKWLARAASGVQAGDQKMTTDSVFAIYSCTKMLAAIAVMQLVEQGKLDLDEPVGRWVPEIDEVKMLDGSKPDTKITMRMLLSHTAGFSYTFFNSDLHEHCKSNNLDEFEPGHWKEYVKMPLIAQPGTEWNYGINIDYAGKVLEKITGQSLGQYSKENIFDKVGCKDLAYKSLFNPASFSRFVALNARSADGSLKPRDHLAGTDFDSGGAGCLGTLEDYLKCIVVMVNEGKAANGAQILKPETVEEMWKDQLEGKPPGEKKSMYKQIPNARPEYTNPVEVAPGMEKGWAISACLTKDPWPTGRSANSIWWAGLPNLFWMADRQKGVVNMVMTQIFPFSDLAVLTPWLAAEKVVYDSLET